MPPAERRAQGSVDPAGAALCLVSATGFGAMAIFGKQAYEEGVTTLTLLVVRFGLASAIFALALAARPALAAGLRGAGRRTLAIGVGLGAVGYATQAGLFVAALQRLDASLLALVLYTYPAWVMLASMALGRERPTRARIAALGLASVGLVALLAGAAGGSLDAVGVLMGLGAALTYTAYILVADRAALDVPPVALTALVCAGATLTLGLTGLVSGTLRLGLSGQAWLWLGLIAVVSTALPIVAFFAGLARVGPSAAAILSSFEPVVTVVLAALVFAEALTGVQLAGAALVLAAAVLLAARGRPPAVAPPD